MALPKPHSSTSSQLVVNTTQDVPPKPNPNPPPPNTNPSLENLRRHSILQQYGGVPRRGKNQVYMLEEAAKRAINLERFLAGKREIDADVSNNFIHKTSIQLSSPTPHSNPGLASLLPAMVLKVCTIKEVTMICVENSKWMRNGDYAPTRFQVLVHYSMCTSMVFQPLLTRPFYLISPFKWVRRKLLPWLQLKLHLLHPNHLPMLQVNHLGLIVLTRGTHIDPKEEKEGEVGPYSSNVNQFDTPLHIPRAKIDPPKQVTKHRPLNYHVQEMANDGIVEDLFHVHTTISLLQLLQTCPEQRAKLLKLLNMVETPLDNIIVFYPSTLTESSKNVSHPLKIYVEIGDRRVWRCIVDEGSTILIISYSTM
eukprot:Gb_32344 [translate_table: standard]